ncbi:MAG: FAD binding domain-containing protein [Anaerolineales bacterium]|nr:FAD binding domain-containing protein [Anaerolineales bacterium]
MSVKEYFLPQSLTEATGLLAEHGPSLLVMAGGTIAMPLINEGISMPERVMGLRRAGLNYTQRSNGAVAIGATTTLTQIVSLEAVPLLQTAADNAGSWSIRNMGTIGGNIFAPPPAGDVAVALLALDAQVRLVKQGGERLMPLADFYTGFMTNALEPDELLAEIRVPAAVGKTAYLKYGRKHAVTPAIVTVAAHLVLDGSKVKEARLALNGVGPHPLRARKAERVLAGSALTTASIAAAAQAASEECNPFTDAIATEWYRRKMVGVYVKRALAQIAGLEA